MQRPPRTGDRARRPANRTRHGASAPSGSAATRRHLTAASVALAVVLALVGLIGALEIEGDRLHVMETASMCPAVCVGSLVVDRPPSGPLHVGELVTFSPPGAPRSTTYTHAIFKLLPGGEVETKGLGNARPDPWEITRGAITGEVAFTIWGLGWLVKALPLLAVGTASWAIGRGVVARTSQRAWDRAWMTALAVLPVWALRPLLRGSVLSVAPPSGTSPSARALVVNTGLLPASFVPVDGASVGPVGPGHVAVVSGDRPGSLLVHEHLALYWWGWCALALVVASPLLGYAWHLWRDDEVLAPEESSHHEDHHKPLHLAPGHARRLAPRALRRPARVPGVLGP